jgi:hypothetical protein
MQCARAILSSVSCPALQYISTLSHKRHDFRKKKITEHTVLISSANFIRNISHSKKKWARYDKKCMFVLHVKYPLFLSDVKETWLVSTILGKYSNTKFNENPSSGSRIVPCGQMEARTDTTQLIVSFRNFANAPKKDRYISIRHVTLQHYVGVAYLQHYSNIDGLMKRFRTRAVLVHPETSGNECGGNVILVRRKQISSTE